MATNLSKEKKYYVYAYLDPRKEINKEYLGINFKYEPFYIGKGFANRKFKHLKEYEDFDFENSELNKAPRKLLKIRKIFNVGLEPIIIEIDNNLNEKDAFDLEEIFISEIGRIEEGGSLFNYRMGGEYGGCLSQESKDKIKESLKIYYKSIGRWDYEKDCMISLTEGTIASPEHRLKISKALKGKKQKPDAIEKRAEGNRKNWEENKEARLDKMQKTMEENGYVRDNVAIGKKISKTKKGNTFISLEQIQRSSETVKKRYASGELVPWNKGIKTGKTGRVYIVKEETKEKTRLQAKNETRIPCEYCEKLIRPSFVEYHKKVCVKNLNKQKVNTLQEHV